MTKFKQCFLILLCRHIFKKKTKIMYRYIFIKSLAENARTFDQASVRKKAVNFPESN